MTETLRAVCPAISCEGCANSIRKSLGRLDGVEAVDVSVAAREVEVRFDASRVSADAVRARLDAAGFPPQP